MTIAVDTSVLIDLLGDDPRADAAEACLRMALGRGPVVVCDVVVSEVTAGLGHGAQVMDALEEMGVTYSAIEQRAAVRAGEMQRKYKERLRAGSSAAVTPRTIPDFQVGVAPSRKRACTTFSVPGMVSSRLLGSSAAGTRKSINCCERIPEKKAAKPQNCSRFQSAKG